MSESVEQLRKARARICLRIAEAIEHEWPNIGMEGYDVDIAARRISQFMPLTYAEADAEMDAMKSDPTPCQEYAPSLFAQLREAVHATPEMSTRTVLEAAIAKCKAGGTEAMSPAHRASAAGGAA